MKKKFILIFLAIIILLLVSLVSLKLINVLNINKLKADITLGSNEAMFAYGGLVNSAIHRLSGSPDTDFFNQNKNVKFFKKANSLSITPTNDNIVSTSDSPKPIYMWFDNGTIYWYSEASKIYLNSDSGNFFSYLSSISFIDLNNFDTSKVTNMRSMFGECSSLTSLNLMGFNTSNVTLMDWMFSNCYNLKTIYVSDKFVTGKVTNSYNMFTACEKLTGGNGTSYLNNYNIIDKTYARIDKPGTPGYFTGPSGKIVIDNPSNNGVVQTNDLRIWGWGLSSLINKRVDVYIDNTKIGTAKNVDRSDKTSIYATGESEKVGDSSTNPLPGWSISYDIGNLSTGNHTIKVILYDTDRNVNIAQATRTFQYKPNTYIYIDSPTTTTTYKGSVSIYGWYLSKISTKKLEIYVDSNKVSKIDVDPRSNDIDAIYNQGKAMGVGDKSTNPNPGFIATYDITKLSDGNHTVEVRAINTSNNSVLRKEKRTFKVKNVKSVVTFNNNDGSNKTATRTYVYGASNQKFDYIPTRSGYKLLGWAKTKTATSKEYSTTSAVSDTFITNNPKITLYAVWQPYKVTISLNAAGGSIVDTANGYKINSNVVYKDGSKYTRVVKYGETVNLINYNNPSYLNIQKRGYTAKQKAEWINKSNSKTYNQDASYNATDFCDIKNGDCNVTLTINWTKDGADDSKLVIKNNTYVIQKKGDTKKTITDLLGVTEGIKVISNNVEIDANTRLKSGDILEIGTKQYTIVVLGDIGKTGDVALTDLTNVYKYFKGTVTPDEISKLAADINDNNNIDLSDLTGIYKLFKGTN